MQRTLRFGQICWVLVGICGMWVGWMLGGIYLYGVGGESQGFLSIGTVGDWFGALNCLYAGLAFGLMVLTIRMQSKELEETRDVLRRQLNQQTRSTKAQERLSRAQRDAAVALSRSARAQGDATKLQREIAIYEYRRTSHEMNTMFFREFLSALGEYRGLGHDDPKVLKEILFHARLLLDIRNYDSETRQGYAQHLAEEIRFVNTEQATNHLILLGDFNMNPHDRGMNLAMGLASEP